MLQEETNSEKQLYLCLFFLQSGCLSNTISKWHIPILKTITLRCFFYEYKWFVYYIWSNWWRELNEIDNVEEKWFRNQLYTVLVENSVLREKSEACTLNSHTFSNMVHTVHKHKTNTAHYRAWVMRITCSLWCENNLNRMSRRTLEMWAAKAQRYKWNPLRFLDQHISICSPGFHL